MKKSSLQAVLATVVTAFGCLLLVAGFVVPPLGVIEPSVLTAFGEALTFAGALLGIDYHYKSKDPEEPPSGEPEKSNKSK